MTTINIESKTCAVCGHASEFPVLGSSSAFGSPDLDLRPPEIQRSSIEYWVQICPSCGNCASDISSEIDGASAVVHSDAYRRQLGDPDFPPLANGFLCHSMLEENAGDHVAAAWSSIHAAWVSDDARRPDQGSECRRRAVSLLQQARARQQPFGDLAGSEEALLTDLARRSGQFALAQDFCRQGLAEVTDGVIADVLRFQQTLISARDSNGYTIEDAVQASDA